MINKGYNLKIILLAAGKSERFNGIKLLAKVQQQDNSITIIEHVLQQISASLNRLNINASSLLIATGSYHAQIAKLIGDQYSLDYCENAQAGLGHTIAQSVESILKKDDSTSHIMITLADQVALDCSDYISLIKQSLATSQKLICAQADQKIMSPAIFPRLYFSDLIALKSDKGAKAVLNANKENLQKIQLPNAAIDIDTPQDLIKWYERKIATSA